MNHSSFNSDNFQLKRIPYLKIILCCLLCLPIGILSIILYAKSKIYWKKNKNEKALELSDKAKEWAINGILISFVLFFTYVILSSINVLPNYEKYLLELKDIFYK